MKILITGSSGFIGQHMLKKLSGDDTEIVTISREKGESYTAITSSWLIANKVEVVIHLAGIAHDTKNGIDENEYFRVNTDLTCKLFDAFNGSDGKVFIYLSSIKAIADSSAQILTEEYMPTPKSVYGKSKLAAENYLLANQTKDNKRIFILRPCMVYGLGNKGNLNLLYKIVEKGMPWPLGSFENLRSFCSVDNLCFVVKEIMSNQSIRSGIYHIADDDALSTNELIRMIATSLGKDVWIWKLPVTLILWIVKFGDFFSLPLNTDRLDKLTSSYIVSNLKITNAIGKSMPVKVRQGLFETLKSFKS